MLLGVPSFIQLHMVCVSTSVYACLCARVYARATAPQRSTLCVQGETLCYVWYLRSLVVDDPVFIALKSTAVAFQMVPFPALVCVTAVAAH